MFLDRGKLIFNSFVKINVSNRPWVFPLSGEHKVSTRQIGLTGRERLDTTQVVKPAARQWACAAFFDFQIANAARLRKSAVGVFYVYFVFLLCYLPQVCNFAVVAICDLSVRVKVFSMASITLLFLNSSLNPVIYCWKMRHTRRAVLDMLGNVLPN